MCLAQVEVLTSDAWRCTEPCTYHVAVVGAPGDDVEYGVMADYYNSGVVTLVNGEPQVRRGVWRRLHQQCGRGSC